MRDLGATRLSRKTDESTSIERQHEQIELTSRIRGDTLVRIAEDTDISGNISPFERDGLGPWLTEPDKIDKWDCLIVPKLDRLTRSLRDFDELVDWLNRNGKTLVSVSESLDLSTPSGRMAATMLAMFAQFERERIAERRRERAADDKARGWWGGQGYNYGLRPVKVNDHWELEIDPATYARLEDIARSLIAGRSANSIASHLNATNVPTPRGRGKWRQNTIRDMFAHPKCPLDPDLLVRVTEALDKTKQPWTKRADAAMLLNIAYCKCGVNLKSKRYVSKGHLYEYYDCYNPQCHARRIPMGELDETVDDLMLLEGSEYADAPVWRKVVIHGKSHATQIAMIERKIRALDMDDPEYDEKHAELMAERKQLKDAERKQPDKTEFEDTGMTVRDYWPTLDRQAKRQFLLLARIKVADAERRADGRVVCEVQAPWPVRFIMIDGGLQPVAA
jgi:DNA invertase Pin-like site-specific DNA recombinase